MGDEARGTHVWVYHPTKTVGTGSLGGKPGLPGDF